MPAKPDYDQALERLKAAAIIVADVLDGGDRDPTWHETQELEEAAINFGRAARTPATTTRRRARR